MSAKRPCGSSWVGFWKRPDRGQAWVEFAAAARDTHNSYIWAANLVNTPKSAAAMSHLRKLLRFALARAEKHGVDVFTHPLNKAKYHEYMLSAAGRQEALKL